MIIRKHLLIALAATFSLSLVGCGGDEPPTGVDTDGALSGSSLDTSGLTPLTPTGGDTTTPDIEPAAEEYPEEEYTEEEAIDDVVEGEETPAGAAPDPALAPDLDNVLPPYTPEGGNLGGGGSDYAAEGNFKIDRDTFNQWQGVSIATDGASLFVTAVDSKMPAKGTVIQMNAADGEGWKDMGKGIMSTITLGALGYTMPKTVQGIALDDLTGNLVVNDIKDQMFLFASPKYSAEAKKTAFGDALDIAATGGNIFLATATGLQKFDGGLTAGTAFGTITPSGGLGTDSSGNLYVISGSSVHKLDSSGNATEIVKELSSPIDVAIDGEGNVFVLESDGVKYFDKTGASKGQFGVGEIIAPKSIAADSMGAVYVADFGNNHKDSQVMKFSKGGFATASFRRISTMNSPDVN